MISHITQTEIYAGRDAWSPADGADGSQTVELRFPLDAVSVKTGSKLFCG